MALVAVPNVSAGKDPERVQALAQLVGETARLLDVHRDPIHNRSVFTVTGAADELATAMAALAEACSSIDLTEHRGVHPRLGGLDVCPIVPFGEPMANAIDTAHRSGRAIAERARLPVYFYDYASTRSEAVDLPSLRRAGLEGLIARAQQGFVPDAGPKEIDPRRGVVCVGARDVLVAFNVWLRSDDGIAKEIAANIRTTAGGLPGVRALGLPIEDDVAQVALNLTEPATTSVDDVFELIEREASHRGAAVFRTEIVGLPPERFLPKRKAARLLCAPGRSLESALDR